MRRDLYEPDHEAFREVVQAYVKREVSPNQQRWEQEHIVDRQAWLAAGKQAIIGHLIPERFGGLGTQDFRFRCVVMEEFATVGATSLSFMAEYPIARAYADARVQTIYGGTSEIMKTIIARDLTGLRT
jgi:alkylation response protein AidB-like acyl-CoA dehydrogenase